MAQSKIANAHALRHIHFLNSTTVVPSKTMVAIQGPFFVFNQLADQIGNFSFDIDMSGIEFSVGPDLFAELNVFDTIFLVDN